MVHPAPEPAPRAAGRSGDRFPCFDGIRALSALMMIAYHAVFFANRYETPGGRFLWNLNCGVWVFFATSGFFLYLPFAAAHLRGAPSVNLRSYARRRVSRIYPAYWAVLAFFVFVVPTAALTGPRDFLLHLTLTQTYVPKANPFMDSLPHAWTLVVEVTFYAFLPVYAAAMARLARTWPVLRVELVGAASFAAVGIIAIVLVAVGYKPAWITLLPQRAPALALGMLLAVVVSHPWRTTAAAKLERVGRAAWMWWTLALILFVAIPVVLRIEPFATQTPAQIIALNICQTFIGFSCVLPAVLGAQDAGAIRRFLRSRPLVFLGTISYGLYLWHWDVLRIVQFNWLGRPPRGGNWVESFLVALPVVIAAATASWYLLERPILRWAHAPRSSDPAHGDARSGDPSPALRDA